LAGSFLSFFSPAQKGVGNISVSVRRFLLFFFFFFIFHDPPTIILRRTEESNKKFFYGSREGWFFFFFFSVQQEEEEEEEEEKMRVRARLFCVRIEHFNGLFLGCCCLSVCQALQ
jgi:hypothetical protein